jgi:hypothetical protein
MGIWTILITMRQRYGNVFMLLTINWGGYTFHLSTLNFLWSEEFDIFMH